MELSFTPHELEMLAALGDSASKAIPENIKSDPSTERS
jgi:hypothetical protein